MSFSKRKTDLFMSRVTPYSPVSLRHNDATSMLRTSQRCPTSDVLFQRPSFLLKRENMCLWSHLSWQNSVSASKIIFCHWERSHAVHDSLPDGCRRIGRESAIRTYRNAVWWFSEEPASLPNLLQTELGKGQVSSDENPHKNNNESVQLHIHMWANIFSVSSEQKQTEPKMADSHPCDVLASQRPNLLLIYQLSFSPKHCSHWVQRRFHQGWVPNRWQYSCVDYPIT